MKKTFALFAVLLLIPVHGFGQDLPGKIDKLLQAYHDRGLLNGSILIAENGKVIYARGFGFANFEWAIPNTTDTKFRIASVSKLFTGVMIMQQVQAGKVSLDAPILTYLPEYRKDTAGKVTVRHLLTHTSGIPGYVGRDIENLRGDFTPARLADQLCSGDLVSEPGTKFAYNNCGYLLLGMILQNVSGLPYPELLRVSITEPLGMKDTGIDDGRVVLPKRAYGYDRTYLRGLRVAGYTELPTAFGAGDIYSTPEDMLRFDEALYTDKLLSAEMRRLMFTPENERTGLTWFIDLPGKGFGVNGQTVIEHHGNIWGFFTNYMRVPERHLFVVTIDNTHMPFEQLNRDILSVLYGKPAEPPRIPIGAVMGEKLRNGDSQAAVAEYRRLWTTDREAYDFSEPQLNRLGYELLNMGRSRDAIAIFKLNTEMYPASANVYDSLGEAYMIDGQRESAISNYEQTLKLQPNNPNASQMLVKLKSEKQNTGK